MFGSALVIFARRPILGALVALALSNASCMTGRISRSEDDSEPRRETLDAFEGCSEIPTHDDVASPDLEVDEVFVNFLRTHQRITGFGASSAWTAPELPSALADQLFTTDGIGLSLLRIQVRPEGFTAERRTAEAAVARGARVWAAPWSPPGEWKSNGKTQNGGSLLPERYADWADRLASFARQLHDRGIPLMAISAQNEPNWTADWDTCRWTPTQLASFIRDHLGPALRDQGLDTKVLAPETINWASLANYSNPLLADPDVRQYIDAVATHSYGGTPFAYKAAPSCNVEIWQTEVSDSREATGVSSTTDVGIDSGLRTARLIHDHLAIAQVSAWHYWWIRPRGDTDDSNGGLLDKEGRLTRRAYVLGNWSKFARPGFIRVGTVGHSGADVHVTAFLDPAGTRFAIVAVNHEPQAVSRRFLMSHAIAGSIVPWVTSAEHALEAQAGIDAEDIDAKAHRFEFTLPARSVTTLVGDLAAELFSEPDAPSSDAGL